VHPGTGRIGDHHIGMAVFCDELRREHIFHISGKEKRVCNPVDLRVDSRIGNRLLHIFYPDDLSGIPCHKVGDGARTGIKVIHQLIARELRETACHLVEVICLLAVGLVERFGSNAEP
jgi:hypothetical protein